MSSFNKIAQVLEEASFAMRTLAEERDAALSKLAAYERRLDIEKTAHMLVQKGLTQDPFDRVVSYLDKLSEADFIRYADAVKVAAPDMGEQLARLANDGPAAPSEQSAMQLTSFLMS